MNNQESELKFIRYSRKSDEAKERQEYSIPEQNEECEKCAAREKLNVILELEEEKSAFKPHKRPIFDEMLQLIREGQINAILTWKENRLCRNPEEGGIILQLLQDGVIKEIRCVASNTIYTPESDHLVLQIHFGMANQFSRNLSKDVRRGLEHKAERGEYPRPAPIGFESFGEVRKRNIRPHSFEAPIIRELCELAATGKFSLGYLVNYAYEKGLKTNRGKTISQSHLYNILTCPTYYGYFYHNGELYKGNYEPITTKSLFDAVQAALKNRSKPRVNSWNGNWNGVANCYKCGCAITTTNKTKYYKRTDRTVTYSYHHCTHRRGNCNQPPVTTDDFEKELLDNVSKINIDEEVWSLGIKLLKEKHKHETVQNSSQRKQFEKEYDSLQQKLNRLINMRADGELTKEEFLSQKELLLKGQARIESLLNDTKTSEHNWLELTEQFLNNAFHAREIMESGLAEEKRKLIFDVGENLFLRDKKIDFSFKQPYDILLQPQYRTNVLPSSEIIIEALDKIIKAFESPIEIEVVKTRWEEIKKLRQYSALATI